MRWASERQAANGTFKEGSRHQESRKGIWPLSLSGGLLDQGGKGGGHLPSAEEPGLSRFSFQEREEFYSSSRVVNLKHLSDAGETR